MMEQKLPEEDLIRRYLLGTLREPELSAIEERLLSNDELSETADVIEDEIVEEYLNGGLSRDDQRAVETHFLRPPQRREKVRFARLLQHRLEPETNHVQKMPAPALLHPVHRYGLLTYGGLAAAVLLGASSVSLLVVQHDLKKELVVSQADLTQERQRSADLEATLRAVPQSATTLELRPVTRGNDTVPELILNPAPLLVKVDLILPRASAGSYRVRLMAGDREIWSTTGLKSIAAPPLSRLVFDMPLTPGQYNLVVSSMADPSQTTTYPFHATTSR
jgi:hypothetical protein